MFERRNGDTMNPQNYAEQAITVEPANPTPWFSPQGLFAVVLRFGYPVPERGAELFYGPRGKVNGTLDMPVLQLQSFLAETIENVAEDCISVLSGLRLDEPTHARIVSAIRKHFEI